MWVPNSIEELLDERIEFCQRQVDSTKIITNENSVNISNFNKALIDFKYCKNLLKNINQRRPKVRFKKLAIQIIMDILHSIEISEHQCISIHGVIFPTKEKSYLPQEVKDNFEELKLAMEKIYNEIQAM